MKIILKLAKPEKLIVFGTISYFVVVFVIFLLAAIVPPNAPLTHWTTFIFLLVLVIPLVAALLAPRAYMFNEDSLRILRVIGSISIPYNRIVTISNQENVCLDREFGNGGLFAYYGVFRDEDGRRVRVYATTFKRMVRIETTDGKIFYLSPAEPEKFVEALRQRLEKLKTLSRR
ncbi:PH domain-containing protein [Desulfothermobacter acidiphilus]|uniref:PH domain-containing protein n=1 Tax=Desulfothermobacter acidiphilus TaxID=1938353 RepID=UPI003F8CEF15